MSDARGGPAGFLAERETFALRHGCEECAYFVDAREACANGWPTAPHRRARVAEAIAAGVDMEPVFCKEFELR